MNIRQALFPQSWQLITIGEVVEVLDNLRKPITKRDRVEGEYPYYGATGILSYVHNYIFSEKLVLIGEDGAKWLSGDNTSFIAKGKYWVNNHAHVIRPIRKIILDEWVVYYLNFTDLTPFVTGMTVPKLNQEKMRSIPIPLPPLLEQKRIVAILDECFIAIAKAKSNEEQNLRNAKELFESYLHGVLADEKWERKTIGEICERVEYGSSTKSKVVGEIAVLRMGNVRNGRFTWDKLVYSDDVVDNRKYLLKYNDVLFNRTNSPELVGKTAIYKGEMPAIFAGYLIRLHRKENLVDADYLNYYLNSEMAMEYGKTVVISSVNQANINGTKLKGYPIPCPPLKAQQAIVQKLDALSSETKRLEAIYQTKINKLEELKKSILEKAFSGELSEMEVAS